jgi:UDP-N-acetylglucosamine 4,6-dehydratase/5-epimerase
MFNSKNLLITGGTGFFGKSFIKYCLKKKINFKKIIIFSRDEYKQYEMQKIYNPKKYKFLRYFLGDIRDQERLKTAFNNVDFVIHAAALKHVPAAEYNPIEFIKTNIFGSQNIIEASIFNNVKKIVALSTDKAASPLNLYGATKLCLEKLFISANNVIGKKDIKFSCVRYGNVLGSRGSVLPLFLEQNKKQQFFTVTDKKMTRFNIMIDEAIEMVLFSLNSRDNGDIIIPKIPSIKITDLAKAINSRKKIKYIGIRPGEKLHEELLTVQESLNTYDNGKYFILKNNIGTRNSRKLKKTKLKNGFNSLNNNFLSISEIKDCLEKLTDEQ